jgi:hypothetical protein
MNRIRYSAGSGSFESRLSLCHGHSVAVQTENYAYLGMYWTWSQHEQKPDTADLWLNRPEIGRTHAPRCAWVFSG